VAAVLGPWTQHRYPGVLGANSAEGRTVYMPISGRHALAAGRWRIFIVVVGIAQRVFLSYTSELSAASAHGRSFVSAAQEAVTRAGCVVVDMSHFTSRSDPPAAICREALATCDAYAGLIGLRYGSSVPDQPDVSYMEFEFDIATEAGLKRLVFLLDENADDLRISPARLYDTERDGWFRQQRFRERLRNAELTTYTFSSPDRLELLLFQALWESGLASAPWTTDTTARLPGPRVLCGRKADVDSLVEAWLATPPEPVVLLGGPGIGKTAVCLAALHDRRIQERFGARRWFVPCDGAFSARALLLAVAAALGMISGGSVVQLVDRVRAVLGDRPGVVVLDNFETPWNADTVPVEELLRTLGSIPGLALATSIRGTEWPAGLRWQEVAVLSPLPLSDARRLFLHVAGGGFASDPALDGLVGELDGMPLAVELLGYAAQGGPDLAGVARRWREERTELLKRKGGDRPELSVAVSVDASVDSSLMTASALRLFCLLGMLPDGVTEDDLTGLLPGQGQAAVGILRKLGLVFDDASRVRMLAPVREHARAAYPPEPADLTRAVAHYARAAAVIQDQGSNTEGSRIMAQLQAEAANIAVMLRNAPDDLRIGELVEGMCGMIQYWSLTGTVDQDLLDQAESMVELRGAPRHQARMLRATGDLARVHSDHDAARDRYERAMRLFRSEGEPLGEANCIMGLGDIERARRSYQAAADRYEAALPLYRQAGSVLGEANCIKSLGDVARERSDLKGARTRYTRALRLYQSIAESGSIGWTHVSLARLEDPGLVRTRHWTAARKAWASIDRFDLIDSVKAEFD